MNDLDRQSFGKKITLLLAKLQRARVLDIALIEEGVALCLAAMQNGLAADALPLLQRLHERMPDRADIALLLGRAYRLEQCLIQAESHFANAMTKHPADPDFRFGLAQTRFELGLPAAELFEQAAQLLPGNLEIVRNRAAAMAIEGDLDAAIDLLETTVTAHPDWLDGHKALATLNWTQGGRPDFAQSYAAACRAQPRNQQLWLARFRMVALTKNWVECRAILDQAQMHVGDTPALAVCRLYVATESGELVEAECYLTATANIQDETVNLCRIRHHLKQGQFVQAQNVAIPLLLSRSASLFWPYLSIAWRMLGDQRHLWLDRPDLSIKACKVDLTARELAELAEVARALHVLERPYLEQSVRGGTQTDRSIILRHEPILQLARQRWLAAIAGYIAELPAFEQGHPLLGVPRNHVLIAGSWSVRLSRQGHNVPHNHPMGWLSTAFYIALPEPSQMGPAPAGHIGFGTPPTDLNLGLPAYKHIAPQVGETAIFPSTMWHSTVPFADGERLSLALDIRVPDY